MEQGYLYFAHENPDGGDMTGAEVETYVMIVSKEYWEMNRAIESVHLADDLGNLPSYMEEFQESMFVAPVDLPTVRHAMEEAGFEWCPDLTQAGQES